MGNKTQQKVVFSTINIFAVRTEMPVEHFLQAGKHLKIPDQRKPKKHELLHTSQLLKYM